MRTLLVLAKQPELAAALGAIVDPERYRVVPREDLVEAEPLLRQGLIDVLVLDAELTSIQPIRIVEQVLRLAPGCPVFICAGARQWEWEEEAYLLGVKQILAKPVRPRLFATLLERLWTSTPSRPPESVAPPAAAPAEFRTESLRTPRRTLEVLRDVSGVLSHALCPGTLLKEFLLLLREVIGVNRAAIFLRTPPGEGSAGAEAGAARRLHSICAIGIAPGLLEHFTLSLDAGIGGYVSRQGKILKCSGDEAGHDREIQKEFELLGAQVAIPILDRESAVGVAVFDDRLMGEPIANEELALIFHLLEQLGVAIRNGWLHDELATNHEMMANILGQLSSGCVVIGRNLDVLHANPKALTLFARQGVSAAAMEFCDLPQILGSKVFEALKTGQGQPPFRCCLPAAPSAVYQAKITPFCRGDVAAPNVVLLMMEEITHLERAQQLEMESARLSLIQTIAERLAHEIGNALVPLSTHQQLLPQKIEDPEFRASHGQVLADGVKRISRLSQQMLFLARETIERRDTISVASLMQEAFAEAQAHYPDKKARLLMEAGNESLTLIGNHSALKHALAEIQLNALQACPANPQVTVRCQQSTNGAGKQWLTIDIQDDGKGFSRDTLAQVQQPFFTTRNVGLGLGLTVARKITEAHQGKLEIIPGTNGQHGVVRFVLPLPAA